MNAYIVKQGISGDGYSIKGVYLDYQLARELCDKLTENHFSKMQYHGNDYWSDEWAHYVCIAVIELDKEIL